MFKIKILISISIFSFLLIGTSALKNQTREIEKKIYDLSQIILFKERDLNESQLDFSYLTSPLMIEKKVEHLDNNKYFPMEYSRIFLSMSSYMDLQKKHVKQKHNYEKIQKK